MSLIKQITTSWDDGHPLDFRIADLLEKYNLKGTFYIPRTNTQNIVMAEDEILSLSRRFEIGGHTLNHVDLRQCTSAQLRDEIKGCYDWLADLTGRSPSSFCPPFGKYTKEALEVIDQSGFKTVRTTVLLSPHNTLPVTDTTMQVYNHSAYTYTKHLLIRNKWSDLRLWLGSGATVDAFKLANYYLDYIEKYGGCFHLWGHSWEIEKFGLWNQLEALFSILAERKQFSYVENKDIKG